MNTKSLEEIIKSNDEVCPEFMYSNPLLDTNVTRALSKSYIKILNNLERGRNRNARNTVIDNIRSMCKTAPEGHVEIDDELTGLLTSIYEKYMRESIDKKNEIDLQLDAFLIRNLKTVNLTPTFQPSVVNPEVLQAMLNLNKDNFFDNLISKDIVNWNNDDKKLKKVIQNLWNQDSSHSSCFYENISIKIKSTIELVLLDIAYKLINKEIVDVHKIFSTNNDLKLLVKSCSVSPNCFQISINILNSLFITTYFNDSIADFIHHFIEKVKLNCKATISVLYPTHLSNLATLLDISLSELSLSLKQNYIKITINYLKTIHNTTEYDLIMLLSHYQQWFDIYFGE